MCKALGSIPSTAREEKVCKEKNYSKPEYSLKWPNGKNFNSLETNPACLQGCHQ
jgi:hypothetical protein